MSVQTVICQSGEQQTPFIVEKKILANFFVSVASFFPPGFQMSYRMTPHHCFLEQEHATVIGVQILFLPLISHINLTNLIKIENLFSI